MVTVRTRDGGSEAAGAQAEGSRGMEAKLADPEHEPVFRSFERAWRWSVLRTIRDQQLAERRCRPISEPNARRLRMRRRHRVTNWGSR